LTLPFSVKGDGALLSSFALDDDYSEHALSVRVDHINRKQEEQKPGTGSTPTERLAYETLKEAETV
jgi:hypothetical protein